MIATTRLAFFSGCLVTTISLLAGASTAANNAGSGDDDSPSLEARLLPLIEAHQGKVAVAVKHLTTGESYTYHADDAMPTASLIKFPVMIEAYRQAAEDMIDLNTPVVLTEEDKVPGSGILTTHFSSGASFALRDAIRLMIAFSDNTATNLVLDRIGIGATAHTMEKMGFPNTKIHSKVYKRSTSVFPERSEQFGLGSTTANEMVRLFESLYKKEIISDSACDQMIEHLKKCDDTNKFPRLLPPGTTIAFKTGSVNASRTAAGLFLGKGGPFVICVMTDQNEDQSWGNENAGDMLCSRVALQVYNHFLPQETEKPD